MPSKEARARRVPLVLMSLALALLVSACTGSSLRGSSTGWSPAVAEGGTVYVGTKQGEVKALEDGGFESLRVKWTYCVEWKSSARENCAKSLGGVYDTPVVGAELVYVSGVDGYLYALDKETGAVGDKGWRRAVGLGDDVRSLVAGPALDPQGSIVVVGSENGNLYAFDARPSQAAGEAVDSLRWTFVTGGKIWSTPVIRSGVVYFGSHDKYIYAVDLDTGDEVWRFPTGGAVAGRPLLFKDLVVAGSFDRKLYAIDADDGTLRWTFQGSNWFWAGAVADDRTIYAPSMDGNIYALDGSGNLLWSHDVGSPIVSRPVLVPRGLAVAGKNGKVALLSTAPSVSGPTREISAVFIRDAEVKAPLFADGDAVFVGAQDGTVTRLNTTSQREVWCFATDVPGTALEYREVRCD